MLSFSRPLTFWHCAHVPACRGHFVTLFCEVLLKLNSCYSCYSLLEPWHMRIFPNNKAHTLNGKTYISCTDASLVFKVWCIKQYILCRTLQVYEKMYEIINRDLPCSAPCGYRCMRLPLQFRENTQHQHYMLRMPYSHGIIINAISHQVW